MPAVENEPVQRSTSSKLNWLNNFGFNPFAEATRLQQLSPEQRIHEFNLQLESHINHVTADLAVSNPYNYWLGKNGDNLYSYPIQKEIYNVRNQIDKHERNGVFYEGILEATRLAYNNPSDLIALYSPTGKKLFNDTPINDITQEQLDFLKEPYDIGQLYFLRRDGEKIRNVAVSINSDSNPWLMELGLKPKEIKEEPNEETKIINYLTRPVNLGNFDDFFNKYYSDNDPLIFKNVNQREFYLTEVLQDMRSVLLGNKKVVVDPRDKTIQALQRHEVCAQTIIEGYLYAVHEYMHKNNLTSVTFGGNCGGTKSSDSEIRFILGLEPVVNELVSGVHLPEIVSSFSTAFRNVKQKSKEKWGYHDGACIICKIDPTKIGPCGICKKCEKTFN